MLDEGFFVKVVCRGARSRVRGVHRRSHRGRDLHVVGVLQATGLPNMARAGIKTLSRRFARSVGAEKGPTAPHNGFFLFDRGSSFRAVSKFDLESVSCGTLLFSSFVAGFLERLAVVSGHEPFK